MDERHDCRVCRTTATPDLPPRERVVLTPHWRAAHAFDTALPGWLVLLPTRHVTGLDGLTDAEGFSHVHFHVVPRMPDQPPEARGPRVFQLLGVPERDSVPVDERDRLALALAAALDAT